MQRCLTTRLKSGKNRLHSFTLIELLVVIAIIGILVGITLAAIPGVMNNAARNRSKAEIQAMTAALESYKSDNGAYPQVNTMDTNTYTSQDGSTSTGSNTNYVYSSQVLYQALSGKTNFLDTPIPGVKAYMTFKPSQIGNANATANGGFTPNSTYVQDPWTYSYGYNTGTGTSYPYNGNGFFDLWSTAGLITSMTTGSSTFTNTATWIANWQ